MLTSTDTHERSTPLRSSRTRRGGRGSHHRRRRGRRVGRGRPRGLPRPCGRRAGRPAAPDPGPGPHPWGVRRHLRRQHPAQLPDHHRGARRRADVLRPHQRHRDPPIGDEGCCARCWARTYATRPTGERSCRRSSRRSTPSTAGSGTARRSRPSPWSSMPEPGSLAVSGPRGRSSWSTGARTLRAHGSGPARPRPRAVARSHRPGRHVLGPLPAHGRGARAARARAPVLRAGDTDGAGRARRDPRVPRRRPLGARPAGKHPARGEELLAATPEAEARLWRYAASVDWIATVEAPVRSTDELLGGCSRTPVSSPRSTAPTGSGCVCSTGRRAASPVAATPATTESSSRSTTRARGAGPGAIRARGGGTEGASCQRTRRRADLRLDVSTLSATFLGGPSLATLARAGGSRSSPSAVARATSMLRGTRAP